jgi:hypothetical protein
MFLFDKFYILWVCTIDRSMNVNEWMNEMSTIKSIYHFQNSLFNILTVCDAVFCGDFISFFLQQAQRLTVTQQKVEMLSRKTMVTWKQLMVCVMEK